VIRTSRVGAVHGAFVLFAVVLIGRAAQVQLLETAAWRARAQQQQVAAAPLPAPRGRILDATGTLLVESRQLVRLSVAPREVAAAGARGTPSGAARLAALARALAHAGVSPEWVGRATDTARAWVTLPGRFLESDVRAIAATRGVHPEPVLERVPPATEGLRRLVGRADDAGAAVDGLERSLDRWLRGEAGRAILFKDARGRRFDSPAGERSEPRAGSTVSLTINQALQDIAERALTDAVGAMRATGGDLVMLDPESGEVRAMASRRGDPRSTGATALTEPYEPGSTIKPFVAARLLDLGRARVDEVVTTYNGTWALNGRTIRDDHPAAAFSLADVIRFSSNIGIVQFAARLTPREEYELFRDAGFGAPTGFPYPAEESGRLPSPPRWDRQTAASLAMGYALNVTPLQLAVAYAAIANGGELLEPAIVREARASDGRVLYRHARRVVRRVMTEETARVVRGLLRGVVDGGTAESAHLATLDIAGKTGTSQRTENGRYVAGRYTASFVGLFPADHPRLVILVKLDDPRKSIYGGTAAAPVMKTVVLAALAARDAALDRRALAASSASQGPPGAGAAAGAAAGDGAGRADTLVRVAESGSVPYVYRLDAPGAPGAPGAPPRGAVTARAVPDVHGLPVRHAVYALHRAGFRVTLAGEAGAGAAAGSSPSAGEAVPAGSIIRLTRAP